MTFSSRRQRERQLFLDMTPMIDVVFQLLIFFLTTAQMASLSRAAIDLPRERGEQSQVAEQAGLIVNMTADGAIIVSDRVISIDEVDALVQDLVEQAPGRDGAQVKLLIRADRHAPSASLNALVERLHRRDIGAARIATSPPG